jgi:DNA-directed RNA polymerase
MNDLLNKQRLLEQEMHTNGIHSYRRRTNVSVQSSQESTTPYGIILLKKSVDEVSKAIEEFVTDAYSGQVRKQVNAAVLLNKLDPEISAYIALKKCVDGVSKQTTLTKLGMAIANALEDQFKLDFYREQDKFMFSKIYKNVTKKTTNRYYRRYNLLRELNRLELSMAQPWTRQEKLSLGVKLVDIVLQTTGLIRVEKVNVKRNKSMMYVRATESTLNWITMVNERTENLSTHFMPCVIKPKDWTNPVNGGYYTPELFTVPMIKTNNLNYFEDMKYFGMPEEYSAINTLQGTKFGINEDVLKVMEICWESGQSWGSLPSKDDAPLPPFPFNPDTEVKDLGEADQKRFKDWKKAAMRVYQFNARSLSKRIHSKRTMQLAQKFKQEEGFYFVYQNDFRFRKYVCSSYLNPQGSDPTKALLHFYDGKPLGERGAFWLGIQGANTWGNDKVSLLDRYSWAVSNTDWIVACANDPLENVDWVEADKPWQFLAFCFEWKGYTEQGHKFVSRLPVALDGCNNGIQHLSALARDLRGGKATNLLPSDLPNDIYQEVADVCVEVLKERDDEMAKKWLEFGVTRKTTKRPVMVVPYGGTQFSCRGYIEEHIVDRLEGGGEDLFEGRYFEASTYLSSILWEAISAVVVSAREVMGWIQEVCHLMAAEGVPVSWETPTGAYVTQFYEQCSIKRLSTHIDGQLIRPQLRQPKENTVDKRRAVNGGSPNLIHSLDAAAMTKTINLCRQQGLTDFCMIHDSYAVHAGQMDDGRNCTDILFQSLRDAFVEMYENNNPLEDFRSNALEVVDEVPEPPKQGDLDIRGVLKSEYFFS